MKKQIRVLAVVGILAIAGCTAAVRELATSINAATSIVLPEYIKYVKDDPSLDEASKKARFAAVDELQKLIDEARK